MLAGVATVLLWFGLTQTASTHDMAYLRARLLILLLLWPVILIYCETLEGLAHSPQ